MNDLFEIKIRTSNDAFAEGYKNNEVARILRFVADKVERGTYSQDHTHSLHDINGNSVGHFIAYEEDSWEGV